MTVSELIEQLRIIQEHVEGDPEVVSHDGGPVGMALYLGDGPVTLAAPPYVAKGPGIMTRKRECQAPPPDGVKAALAQSDGP
jgi:hypothetical protein